MAETIQKKELQAQYKEREIVGGVYLIRNTKNNKILLDAVVDLQGMKNRFAFARKTGSCLMMKLQADWSAYGADSFTFEVQEELMKGDNQSNEEFKADLELLKKMWLEKLSEEDMY